MLLASTMLAQQMMRDGTAWGRRGSWVIVIVMAVLVLLVLGVIVWAVIYASRNSSGRAGATQATMAPQDGPTPHDILDQRYARGEIDTTEYEERRSSLRSST